MGHHKRKKNQEKIYFSAPIDRCCSENYSNFWNCYTVAYDWYYKYFGYNTPGTVMLLIFKEVFEIGIQNIAFYFYAGSQHPIIKYFNGINSNADKQVILAVDRANVELFSWVIGIDCIILSIMWSLYVCKHKIFHGEFFVFMMFAIDAIFDLFFALFPLTLVDSNSFTIIVGSLNTQSAIAFVASFTPMIWLAWKLWDILYLLTQLAEAEFSKIFRKKKFGVLGKGKRNSRRKKQRTIRTVTAESIEQHRRESDFLPPRNVELTTLPSTSPPPAEVAEKQPQKQVRLGVIQSSSKSSTPTTQREGSSTVSTVGTLNTLDSVSRMDTMDSLGTISEDTRDYGQSISDSYDEDSLICCDDENGCTKCPKKCKICCNACFHGPTCLTRIPFYEEHEAMFLVQYCRRISLLVLSLAWIAYAIYIITTTWYFFNYTTKTQFNFEI